MPAGPVRIGMLGSGFIADFYLAGLRLVADAVVVASASTGSARGADFARRHGVGHAHGSIEALCADPEVDLIVVALPNRLHLEAVRAATAAGKAVICTKPLGRDGMEAAEMLRWCGTRACGTATRRTRSSRPTSCACTTSSPPARIGEVLSVRGREGHSGPHAAHFWDAESAGGGALLDMGCHSVEDVRWLFGKEHAVRDVFAWGDTLVHRDRTSGEDMAVMLLRFEDGRTATVEVLLGRPWRAGGACRGLRHRRADRARRHRRPRCGPSSSVRRDTSAEKADADTGWVFPVADEPHVHGYEAQFRHFVDAFRAASRRARRSRTATPSIASSTPPTGPCAAATGSGVGRPGPVVRSDRARRGRSGVTSARLAHPR